MQMSDERSPYEEESGLARFERKAKEAPFMIAGIVGMLGACGYGAYAYKNRRGMSTSIYLMRLRVIAQGAVVGSLTLGIVVSMLNEHVFNKKPEGGV